MILEGSMAPRAGSDLRAARERLGWALADVAAMLRIRSSYLEALEDGRLGQLPGNVYALGFLRTYATALGLDQEEVSRRFRAEAGEIPRHSQLVFPVPMPERGLPAGALILLGLILVGGAYIGWYHLSGEGKLPAETVAPVPTRLAPLAEQALPGPDGRIQIAEPPPPPAPTPPKVEDNGQFEPRQAAVDNPMLEPAPPPAPPPVEELRAASIPGATATTAIAMPVTPPMRMTEQPVPPNTPPTDTEQATDSARVMLRFTGDTWVQVKERGGQVLLTKVMKAGETFPVPDRPNLILNTGNAGRVEILVDGVLAPPIGGPGAVRKDVPLDPEPLKEGTVVPVSTHR